MPGVEHELWLRLPMHCCINALAQMASLLLADAGDEATGLAAAVAASHGADEKVRALEARVKELEMEQTLMQRELDNMSDVAQRSDAQLR